MQKLKSNDDGFVSHLLFIGIIIGIVGLISYSGHKVWVASTVTNKAALVTPKKSSETSESSSGTSATTPTSSKKVAIPKTGTAAAAIKQTAVATPATTTIPQTVVVNTPYPTTSPEGSLNQLIKELRSKNFQNVLLFITPSFMVRTAALVQTQQQYVTLDTCKNNSICSSLLNTPFEVLKATEITTSYSTATTENGQRLTFYVGLRNNTYVSDLDKLAGDYTVSIDMVPASEHWLVDRITVNGYSI